MGHSFLHNISGLSAFKTTIPNFNGIYNGDALIFLSSGSWRDKLISWWTKSPYVHVGMAYWLDGRLYCLEATAVYGVRLYPLDEYIANGYKCWWFHIENAKETSHHVANPDAINRTTMVHYALNLLGNGYPTLWQFIGTFLNVCRPWDDNHDICSELYILSAQNGGYCPPVKVTYNNSKVVRITPDNIANLPFLKKMRLIERLYPNG